MVEHPGLDFVAADVVVPNATPSTNGVSWKAWLYFEKYEIEFSSA